MKTPTLIAVLSICATPLCAQILELSDAFVLRFDADPDASQLLESSADGELWSPASPVYIAEQGLVEHFTAADQPRQLFRVRRSPIADLTADLETIHATTNVPALGCAVVMDGQIVGLGVTGVRKHGVSEEVTPADRWHHGSMTKSMTAALAGVLVDEGVITWTTKLVDLFPEFAATANPSWNTVTLEMLLTNSSGAPNNLNTGGIWGQLWNHPGTPAEQRLYLVGAVLALQPRFSPGTGYEYSNAGFAMAGAMLERATGRDWESLMTDKLFKRLGMTTAKFGPPATPRYIDHPWGHTFSGTTPQPVAPGTAADNPPGIGPAGTVNCSLPDFARYVAFHLAGTRGEGTLLDAATYQKLYTPVHNNYAMGWGVGSRSWAGGTTYNHTGSNTQWYTNVWIAPGRNWAIVAVTNIGGNDAFRATDAIVAAMIGRFIPWAKPDSTPIAGR